MAGRTAWSKNTSQLDLASIVKISDLLNVDIRELFVSEYKQYLLPNELLKRETVKL